MEAELTASVREISGIGQQRARALGKLGIETLGQLIGWFPRKYDDRTSIRRIADLVPGGERLRPGHDRRPAHSLPHPKGHGSGEGPGGGRLRCSGRDLF